MDNKFIQSREAIMNARDALRRGDMTSARQWAEHAAELAPQNEDSWLILAAVASPRESVEYIRKALQMNPNSSRGRKAMEWAMRRLGEPPQVRKSPENGEQAKVRVEPTKAVRRVDLVTALPTAEALRKGQTVPQRSASLQKPRNRTPWFPILLVITGCIVFGFAAYSAMTSPVLASILRLSSRSVELQPYAAVDIAKPTYTAVPVSPTEALAMGPSIPLERPTDLLPTPMFTRTKEPLPVDTITPDATSTPGTMYAEIVPDTPTPEYAALVDSPSVPVLGVNTGGVHWIDVDLSQQRVYAYAGDTIINSFLVSTGTWQTPTVTGKYKIWIKLRYTDMAGPGYYLPDVPYTMYFYKGYGIHGTYWHNNFGTPMSHGCVNLTIPDAEWLYNFSAVGTVVNVHY